jgi:hypothetical protein
MTSPMRTLRAGLRLLAIAASLGAAAAHASGGGDPVDMFFDSTRPDQPVREFVERPAGYYTDYLVPYQVLWYWRLRGQAFSPDAVRAFSDLLEKLPREDSGMEDTDAAWTEWQQARAGAYAKLGQPLPEGSKPTTPPSGQTPQWNANTLRASPSCLYGDAFRNATKTLAQRMERVAGDKTAGPPCCTGCRRRKWCSTPATRNPPRSRSCHPAPPPGSRPTKPTSRPHGASMPMTWPAPTPRSPR